MQIYLPIAEVSLNVFLLLGMGAGVGFLSGLFGVGGGFLMTPLLIFAGVPSPVAVATEANQIVARTSATAWFRGKELDFMTWPSLQFSPNAAPVRELEQDACQRDVAT